MNTLTEIKNTYAQEQGYADWESLRWGKMSQIEETESDIDEICLRAQKAALEKAAENTEDLKYIDVGGYRILDTTSITNPENLIR